MIDLHTHTKYSKHATCSVDKIVRSAIDKGIKIIAITDHAPFPIDLDNRLHEEELEQYFKDIANAKERYGGRIKVLAGLEVDFTRQHQTHAEGLISRVNADYIIGSIHYIFLKGEKVNVWDIKRTGEDDVRKAYLEELRALLESDLFDAVAHPDILLRGGLDEKTLYEDFLPILADVFETGLSYELNGSGFTKPSYNRKTVKVQHNVRTFPSRMIMKELKNKGISIVIGSDAHSAEKVGKNIRKLLEECRREDLRNLVYFENRKAKKLSLVDI